MLTQVYIDVYQDKIQQPKRIILGHRIAENKYRQQ